MFGSSNAFGSGSTGFGNSSATGGAFGQPAQTQQTAFGSSQFGQSTTPQNSNSGLFGQKPAFGSTSGTGGSFGSNNATSGFGTNTNQGFGANTGSTGFGSAAGASSSFGAKPAGTSGLFGQSNQNTGFGQNTQSTGFGQNNQTTGVFGQSNTNQATGAFGQNNQTTGAFGQNNQTGGAFGQNTQSTGQFGQNNQPTGAFGQSNQTSGAFGNSQSNTGLFAQNNQQQQGGLFGQNNQATPSTGFGQNNTQTSGFGQNQSSTPGTFGQNNQNTQSSGLFSQKPATPSLFGSTQGTGQSQTSGLFSQNNANSGGLFGAPNSGTSASTGTTTGLFGQTNQGNQTTGLFGSNAQAGNTQGTSTTGLFGSQNNQARPMFGTAPQSNTGGFAQPQHNSNLLGSVAGNQAQAGPQITPMTRPSDLSESVQTELQQLDDYITGQGRVCSELKAGKDTHEEAIDSIPRDVELLTRKLATVSEGLVHDERVLAVIKEQSDQAVKDAEACFVLLGNLGGQTAPLTASVYASRTAARKGDQLAPYFSRKIDEFTKRLSQLAETMVEVERGVDSAEQDSLEPGSSNVASMIAALQEEYRLFMSLGNRVAEIHHDVGRIDKAM